MKKFNVEKSEQEWKEQLSDHDYHILREKGTERPYTGELNTNFEDGVYTCKGCGEVLFTSEHKFDSHCGWPSFDESKNGTIVYERDTSFGRIRTEILCANCGGHLGHVFDDGPTATGKRYCVNSASINFKK